MNKSAESIAVAREYRGISQFRLAKSIGLSQGALSKIENGILTPSPDVVRRIARELQFPERFFWERIDDGRLPSRFYRKRASVSQQTIKSIEARVRILRTQMRKLLQAVHMDDPVFRSFHPDDFGGSIESIAREFKLAMRLPRGPIANVTEAVERSGVIVVPCKFEIDGVDGFSVNDGVLPPMIFMSIDVPGDRWRFTLAHEFAHIILHSHIEAPISDRDFEAEADRFASEFLMPASDIKAHFIPRLTMKRLAALKEHWKVSMAALVMRAEQLGKITEHQKRRLFTQMSKLGYRKCEPSPIPREEPRMLSAIFSYYMDHMNYSNEQLCEALAVTEQESARLYPGIVKIRPQLKLI